MTCPTCGGETYDNRQKVAGGWKGPVFKCKDKGCGWVQWPPKEKGQQQQSGPKAVREAKWTWATLNRTYGRCLLLAEQQLKGSTDRTKVAYAPADIVAAAATIFISASRDGVSDPPKPAPKSDPIPEPAYVPDEEPEDSLSDLPF